MGRETQAAHGAAPTHGRSVNTFTRSTSRVASSTHARSGHAAKPVFRHRETGAGSRHGVAMTRGNAANSQDGWQPNIPGFSSRSARRLRDSNLEIQRGIISRTSPKGTEQPSWAAFNPLSIAAGVSSSTSTSAVSGWSSFHSAMLSCCFPLVGFLLRYLF